MPAGSYRFRVGSIGCTVLCDGYFSYPGQWFFPNAEPERLAGALAERRLSADHVVSPFACLLVETGRHVMLVDTGAGESLSTTGAIRARLEMEGIRPKDVDTVLLTHAHPDHVGGATDLRGRSAFPNARYVLAEAEWEFWNSPRTNLDGLRLPDEVKIGILRTAKESLHAIRHQVEPIDGETEVVPGVRALPARGHTPGHLALQVSSDDCALLHIADAALHPLHLEEPGWENGFDLDAAAALATRRDLAQRAAAEGMHVMAFHFPFPSVGTLAATPEGGWKWSPGW